jgi:hypothetical protein
MTFAMFLLGTLAITGAQQDAPKPPEPPKKEAPKITRLGKPLYSGSLPSPPR